MNPSTLLVDARPIDHPTARQRGIGRYVTGLLTGLRDIGAPVVALYGTDTEARALTEAVPGLRTSRWSPQVVREHAVDGTWYLATQLMLHPVPLDPIPRCVTDARLPVAAVMYDVIPYRHPEVYLADPNAHRQAELRAPLARTVDVLLAISDFAATTAAEELRFPIERIGMIGAGVESKFTPAVDDPRERSRRVIPPHVHRYVVAVAGEDDRKNTEGLLRAWAHVDRAIGDSYHLVIAAAHTPPVVQRWQAWASEAGVTERVVFTGGLSDDELVAVLQGAELAVMPSLEEGFGLPVLEAAACGTPAIASNVSSLPEVLDEPDASFDPHDPHAIADAIVRGLTDDAHRRTLLAAGDRATARWTWSNAATTAVDVLGSIGPRWPQRVRRTSTRVAVAGVFDDGTLDPIAGANSDLASALRALGSDLTVLVDSTGAPTPSHAAPDRWPVRSVGRFVKPWDFDHIVAVLGSAPRHLATSEMARSVPCHLWVLEEGLIGAVFGANLHAVEIARSLIVGSAEVADRLRSAADRPCPVLVVPPAGSASERAAALAAWLADVDDLDPSTIRHHRPRVASPDP